jgi:hypothetical protein
MKESLKGQTRAHTYGDFNIDNSNTPSHFQTHFTQLYYGTIAQNCY